MSSDNETANNKPSATEESSSHMGRVKWFNNKAGYGFVTVLGENSTDVFVHHSGIKVENEQYRYLVQGEYVTFSISRSDNKSHKRQATGVRGIMDGKLMCETHLEMRKEREERMGDSGYQGQQGQQGQQGHREHRERHNRRQDRPKAYGGGPREDDEGFTLSKKGRHQTQGPKEDTEE